ncbi:MAG: hypothetical protein KKF33_00445 [Alphaproteobacteria bacterium]|nr:hypothetical protein [Alphaproteobacteria bacterium]
MRFAEIGNSREWTEPGWTTTQVSAQKISVEDVEAEAQRRLRAIRLHEWRRRAFVTGQPMPEDVCQYVQQIEFATRAISCLSTIPDDFDSDVYWPRLINR